MARHPAMSVCSSHCFSAAGTPMTHRFQLSASSSNRSPFPLSLPCCLCLYRPLNRGISPSISREIDCTVGQQTLDLDPFCAHFHSEEARRQTVGTGTLQRERIAYTTHSTDAVYRYRRNGVVCLCVCQDRDHSPQTRLNHKRVGLRSGLASKHARRCSAPAVWNSLPKTVVNSESVAVF